MFRKGGRGAGGEGRGRTGADRELICRPAPSDAEIEAAIAEAMAETGATSAKQMGEVMKAAQAKLAGQARRRESAQR